MFAESATNLLDLPRDIVQNWLGTFDTVLTDCDGVLWRDSVAIGGSPDTVNALKALGKRVFFVTNNGTKTRHELWQRANALGFHIAETNILAPAQSIAAYLKLHLPAFRSVYVIGAAGITGELDAVGIEHLGVGPDVLQGKMGAYIEREIVPMASASGVKVGAVVVGFDEHFSYGKMMKACNYLCSQPDCLFLVTNRDAVHKYPAYHIPDCGAIVAAIETCVGREAMLFGKPNPLVCAGLLEQGLLVPQRTLMIGDCCKVDMTFGKNCGFQTMLVGTGSFQLDHVRRLKDDNAEKHRRQIPDVYLPKLGDLLQYIQVKN